MQYATGSVFVYLWMGQKLHIVSMIDLKYRNVHIGDSDIR